MFLKRFLILCISLVAGLTIFVPAVSAHVLKTDGSIGAVMHIDPDDDPIAGQPATFFFELKDKQNQFKAADCNCTVTITQNDKQLYSAALFQSGSASDINTPVFSYTFPEKSIYTVILKGVPATAGEFQSFTLTYDVRVDRQVAGSSAPAATVNPPAQSHVFHYLLFGGAFLVILFLYLKEKRAGKKSGPDHSLKVLAAGIALTGFFIHASTLDTAVCFHDSPVLPHHQCCMSTPAQVSQTVVVTKVAFFSPIYVEEPVAVIRTARVFDNKSPPIS